MKRETPAFSSQTVKVISNLYADGCINTAEYLRFKSFLGYTNWVCPPDPQYYKGHGLEDATEEADKSKSKESVAIEDNNNKVEAKEVEKDIPNIEKVMETKKEAVGNNGTRNRHLKGQRNQSEDGYLEDENQYLVSVNMVHGLA
jgi:hypothetical protein